MSEEKTKPKKIWKPEPILESPKPTALDQIRELLKTAPTLKTNEAKDIEEFSRNYETFVGALRRIAE